MAVAFSELLRSHRLAAGHTQAALAELAGLSEQAVSLLERGTRRRPRPETIHALSTALKLNDDAEQELLASVRAPSPLQPAIRSLPIPWELPQTVADFTAREDELDKVLKALGRSGSASVALVITGMGGVGKTALAVHAGHLSADRFPDGQLYVSLRGHDPGAALTGAEALGQLLRSLGVRQEAIPDDADEMARLYRSRMAGRRMLILLDDASSVDQVTPLLPGSSGSATIITSRRFLATLPGSLIVRLATFTSSESLRLLASVASEQRVNSEEAAARELSELAGGLPLALRLIGARLTMRPQWLLQHVVDQLQDERRSLDELGLDHSGVRATFASSLNELTASPRAEDRAAATAFDLLSLAGGPEISVQLVARLLEQEVGTTEGLLERLVDLHLLDSIGPLRYQMHDLLRAYAQERLSSDERDIERTSAIERGLKFYVAAAWQAQRVTHPWSPRQPIDELDLTGVPVFADLTEGPAWFDAEYDSIIALYKMASTVPGLARRYGPSLALGLFGYLEIRAYFQRMRTVLDLALASGRPEDDLVTWGWLEHDRAIPEIELAHLEQGYARLLRALSHFEDAQHLAGLARCFSSLSHVCERLDHLDEAIEWGERGLKLAREAGELGALGTSQLVLGVLYNRVGRTVEASASFQASLELADSDRLLARRHRLAAVSYLAAGSYESGIDHLNAALGIYARIDDPVGSAEARQHLGQVELARGNYPEAERNVREGLRLVELHNDSDNYRRAQLLASLAAIQDATAKPAAARTTRLQAIEIFEAEGVTAAAEDLRREQLAVPKSGSAG
ncbi:helix-turn-helix domain-containing protein [Streptomyces sp. SID13031]|uniref:helix-turn-helix domain-containing protein n=1 Tax=Streptomyces sp. SID13031 TaxID=2706046 RepID=UPI0013C9A75F|nr:helix-turn-helix domain-containing protein [Streptomyces sp. SID13031]NEA33825.1 tetratricopeptide repeat protein [Streptomyces sp. SID13031]